MKVSMRINGEQVSADIDETQLLAYFLRDDLNLTGTHIGCDTSQCGACVVHLNGRAVKSCTMLAAQADGADVTTIEGVQQNDELHPVQKAFRQHHALQCGFCTPGMIMAAIDIIENTDDLDEHDVREQLEGNICRCTGYQNIIAAILSAAKEMRG
ncbi:MAG: (2Fe-2S)-binding protein [Hyphomicrobiales bacterium]|nr:(2Fe-2S)-binding protein [Hyphomicrobiales bacterium]